MNARRLIINADDLGVNPQRSHGIFECREFGVVTSASLIPNGSDSDAAAKHARERKVACGLHLNLTEEYPLSKADQIPSLLRMNGMFLDEQKLYTALEEGKVSMDDLEREIRAQIEWCFDAHGSITHVSSHHHIHTHPFVAQALIPVMERYGIRFVRLPHEEPLQPFGFEVPAEQLAQAAIISNAAAAVKDMYAAHGITSTDHFRGLALLGNASLKNLRHVLAKLPEGTTELMVHPGSQTVYGTPFDLDPQRQTELRMLLDDSIKEALVERKITLCSFADL